MEIHGHGKAVLDALNPEVRALRQHIPEVFKGFAALAGAAMAPGALDRKTKELIALAIAVVEHCDGCIAAHAKGAAAAGATEPEVAEAIGVTVLMHGGPGTVYGPRAFAAFQEYLAARRSPEA
ncbi:MAG: carboxymuconolactone decarboxylase family protein [Acidimicrobiales bacterium]